MKSKQTIIDIYIEERNKKKKKSNQLIKKNKERNLFIKQLI